MKYAILTGILSTFLITGYVNAQKSGDKNPSTTAAGSEGKSRCSEKCKAKNKSGKLTCKMPTAEVHQRKETVLASLKGQIIERKELKDGYAFKFPGTDAVLDELTEFIKTERECCDFFVFNLSISGDKSEAWLELTGAEGSKDFISQELGLVN